MSGRVETIGAATLILGDCLQLLDTIPFVDSLCMDPPYGIAYSSGYATDELWGDDRAIANDGDVSTRDAVLEWAGDRPALCFGKWSAPRPAKTKIRLIWDKGGALGMGDLSIPWKADDEEIYVLGKGFIGRRDSGSVLRFPPVQSMAKNGRRHPNEKPVPLLQALIKKLPGTIFDPFMASGSCGVAAMEMGRAFVGIELRERFFDIACQRVAHAVAQGVQAEMPLGEIA